MGETRKMNIKGLLDLKPSVLYLQELYHQQDLDLVNTIVTNNGPYKNYEVAMHTVPAISDDGNSENTSNDEIGTAIIVDTNKYTVKKTGKLWDLKGVKVKARKIGNACYAILEDASETKIIAVSAHLQSGDEAIKQGRNASRQKEFTKLSEALNELQTNPYTKDGETMYPMVFIGADCNDDTLFHRFKRIGRRKEIKQQCQRRRLGGVTKTNTKKTTINIVGPILPSKATVDKTRSPPSAQYNKRMRKQHKRIDYILQLFPDAHEGKRNVKVLQTRTFGKKPNDYSVWSSDHYAVGHNISKENVRRRRVKIIIKRLNDASLDSSSPDIKSKSIADCDRQQIANMFKKNKSKRLKDLWKLSLADLPKVYKDLQKRIDANDGK